MLAQRYAVQPDVLFQDLGEEAVLLNLNNDHYYGLDAVGAHMWRLLDQHGEFDSVVQQMLAEYEVEEPDLRRDLAALLEQLEQAGLIRPA